MGYMLGPILGIWLAYAFGLQAVYAALVVLAVIAAVAVALRVPHLPPLPKSRATVRDLFAIGIVTPLAFAHLAASTRPDRMGRTMGSAVLGRELGDAAGPLVVGGVATVAGVPFGLGILAVLTAGVGASAWGMLRREPVTPSR